MCLTANWINLCIPVIYVDNTCMFTLLVFVLYRVLSDESERSLRDTQQRLEVKERELQSANIKCDEISSRLNESERRVSNLQTEVSLTSQAQVKPHL